MRKILSSLPIVLFSLGLIHCGAQNPHADGSNWSRVQVLPLGTFLRISTRTSTLTCKFTSAAVDSLSCQRGPNATVLQKSEIRSIQVPHHGRSALIGAAIGGAVGATIAAVSTQADKGQIQSVSKGAVVGVSGLAGAIIAAPVGWFSDFTRSTIYRAN